MQNAFYRSFINENEKIIAFIGGGGKTTLIQRLSKDCQRMGKRVVIISLFPYFAPMEAKTFISNDPVILSQQVNAELSGAGILYLGKSIKQSSVQNFNLTDIKSLLKSLRSDHIFLEADRADGCSLSSYKNVSISILQHMDRYINIIGADAFNQSKNKNWLAEEDQFWRKKTVLSPMDIGTWIQTSKLFEKIDALPLPATFFINKVENMYIENTAIPLAKNFKLHGIERVITGSVFNSTLHLIR